jgi:tRNA threonylcarbamoyladenosine biosynthesis protein TsaB
MAILLSIDTAMETAGVCVSDDAAILSLRTNSKQMDHASWMHRAIGEALEEAGKHLSDLQGICVTSGPGSYTGLRVGMAAAKGFCYVLNIPLITETTLKLIATSVKNFLQEECWLCPMIDARRMEVYAALYDFTLNRLQEDAPVILDEHSFQHILDERRIIFAGNGSAKWQIVCHHPNAFFTPASYTMPDVAAMAAKKFEAGNFASLATAEPYYLKNVYTGTKDA